MALTSEQREAWREDAEKQVEYGDWLNDAEAGRRILALLDALEEAEQERAVKEINSDDARRYWRRCAERAEAVEVRVRSVLANWQGTATRCAERGDGRACSTCVNRQGILDDLADALADPEPRDEGGEDVCRCEPYAYIGTQMAGEPTRCERCRGLVDDVAADRLNAAYAEARARLTRDTPTDDAQGGRA